MIFLSSKVEILKIFWLSGNTPPFPFSLGHRAEHHQSHPQSLGDRKSKHHPEDSSGKTFPLPKRIIAITKPAFQGTGRGRSRTSLLRWPDPWWTWGLKWSRAISSPEGLNHCSLMPTWQSWPFQRDCWACRQPSCLGACWKWRRRRRTRSGRAATPSTLASGVLGYCFVSIFQSEVFTYYSSSVINCWGRAGLLNWFGRLPREDNYL